MGSRESGGAARRSRARAATGAAAAVLVLTGCSSGSPTSDPVSSAAALDAIASYTVCMEGPAPGTFGFASLSPRRDVTITAVEVGREEGAKSLGVRIGEPPSTQDLGILKGYPPTRPGYPWADTRDALGATLLAGHRYNVIVGVDLLGDRVGGLAGVTLRLQDGGRTESFVIPHAMAISPADEPCDTQKAFLDSLTASLPS